MAYPPQQPGHQQPGQPYRPPPGAYLPAPPGYPPQLPPQKKGMGTGAILLLVFAGLVGLCCIGGFVSFAITAGKVSSTSGTTAHVDAGTTVGSGARTSTQPTVGAVQHAKVGEPARDGMFEFVVQKIDCGKKEVGNEFLNKTAQGQYCLVTVSVKNIGTQPRAFDGGNQKAFGPVGVEFTNDGVAESYANKDNETFLNDINPGNQVTGVLVFDIPQGGAITGFELHDSFFSGGVLVDVG